jgi:hypothetical protein
MDTPTHPDNPPPAAADAGAAAPAAAPEAAAAQATADGQAVKDMKDMKLVVMDSAELATRAAGLAADTGMALRTAVKDLGVLQKKQSKWTLILMASSGSLMLILAMMFAVMSMRMQARVAMLDEMLVAVGKRVTEMDASLELVGSAHESLKAVAAKQAEMVTVQAKIDGKLEQVIASAQSVPEQTAKQVEARIQGLSKQVSALESRFQSQAASSQRVATQLQSMQGAMGDANSLKREIELLARQQRERQAQENTQAAQAAVKARERLVQYPRQQSEKP